MASTATKSRSRKRTNGTIEITCHAPDAQAVFVAGDFNDWSTTSTPMNRTDEGVWAVKLKLEPGRYEFKFLIDGHWCCEPGCRDGDLACPNCVVNAFGTMNRLIEVT